MTKPKSDITGALSSDGTVARIAWTDANGRVLKLELDTERLGELVKIASALHERALLLIGRDPTKDN